MGSLHCAGMCGPLLLLTPVAGTTQGEFVASRLTYHGGRLMTYALIGGVFGAIGESIVLAGLQRWLSMAVGVAMLLAIALAAPLKTQLWKFPARIKSMFGSLLRRKSYAAIFGLGATNGLLPCGLVYMAATASVAMGSLRGGVGYMFLFGLGTLPMMLGISFAGKRLNLGRFPALQKLAPIAVAAVAILLIVRAEPLGLLRSGSAKIKCPACLADHVTR